MEMLGMRLDNWKISSPINDYLPSFSCLGALDRLRSAHCAD
jgi:hypothetical protein